jgi:hypothetical protein
VSDTWGSNHERLEPRFAKLGDVVVRLDLAAGRS